MTDTPPQHDQHHLSPYPLQPMQAPAFARPPGTNGFAIAALIFGLIGGLLLSVIFGIVALAKIRKTGQSLTRGDYPGDTAIETEACSQCGTLLERYAPQAVDTVQDVVYLYPDATKWRRGDRTVTCVHVDEAVTGSLKD